MRRSFISGYVPFRCFQNSNVNDITDLRIASYYNYYWMGATDVDSEGTWKWRSDSLVMSIGRSMVESTISWYSGEPNDANRNEDCVELWRYTTLTLNDDACSSSAYYVCEINKQYCMQFPVLFSSTLLPAHVIVFSHPFLFVQKHCYVNVCYS